MANDFDPYYKWLGIPPKDQPPHHYRLLAIERYENDVDVIEAAANRQMSYVQSLATGGEHTEHTQRLLNEIAAARLCLVNEAKRRAYDADLRAKDTRQTRSVVDAQTKSPRLPEQQKKPPRPAAKPAPPAALQPATHSPVSVKSDSPQLTLAKKVSVESRPATPVIPPHAAGVIAVQPDRTVRGRGKAKTSNSKTPIIICSAIAGVALLGLILLLLNSPNRSNDVALATDSDRAEAPASDQAFVNRSAEVFETLETTVPPISFRANSGKQSEASANRADTDSRDEPDAASPDEKEVIASAENRSPDASMTGATAHAGEAPQPGPTLPETRVNSKGDQPGAAAVPVDGRPAKRETVLNQDDPKLEQIELNNPGFEAGEPTSWVNVAVVAHARYPLANETGQALGNHFGVTFSDTPGALYLCQQAFEPSTLYHFQCALGRPDTNGTITFEIGYLSSVEDPRSFVALASRDYPLDRKNDKWILSPGVTYQTAAAGAEAARNTRIALRIRCQFAKVGAFWFDNAQLRTRAASEAPETREHGASGSTVAEPRPLLHALSADIIADPKGDGPDGKGNTADDTWQFCFEEVVSRKFLRLNSFYTNPKYRGWSHNHDMDTEYEGAWGNTDTGEMFIHPYAEKTDHRAMVVVFTVQKTGRYKVTGGLTDVVVAPGPKQHQGIRWRLDRQTGGKPRTLRKGGPVGDKAGPDSDSFVVPKVYLQKNDRLCLVVDPNGWWGSDMTRIDSFRIEELVTEIARTSATATDGKAGQTETQRTDVALGLVANWKLDEKRGRSIKDASGGFQGEIHGNWRSQPGAVRGAIAFDGTTTFLRIPDFKLQADRVTLSLWVKGTRTQNWTGIVFSRSSSGTQGMNFTRFEHRLGYHWGADQHKWDGGPDIPANKWALLVLAVEPQQATAYVWSKDGGLQQAVHSARHSPASISGLEIGRQPGHNDRYYRGLIDDVRIYDHALSRDDVQQLVDAAAKPK